MSGPEGVLFSHAGERYLLGYGDGFFGIWQRSDPEEPIRRFPRNDDGWAAAWTEFRTLEPAAVEVPHPPAAGGPPTGEPAAVADRATLAAPSRRLVARVLDAVIVSSGLYVVLLSTGQYASTVPSDHRFSPRLFGWVLLAALAYEVSLTATRGQTLGKMTMRIRVATLEGGTPPGWRRAMVRWVVPVALSIVPFLGIVAFAWLLWDPIRQGLHDKAAGTVVVNVPGSRAPAVA